MNEYQVSFKWHGIKQQETIKADSEIDAIMKLKIFYEYNYQLFTNIKIKKSGKLTYIQLKERLDTTRILLIITWLYLIVWFILFILKMVL